MESGGAEVERRLRALVSSWGLSRFSEKIAVQWLLQSLGSEEFRDDGGGRDELQRLRKWVLLLLNGQRYAPGCSPWQIGCPEVIPGLRATPVWDCTEFPWVKLLEDNFTIIKDELLALRHKAPFQPYRAPTWASSIQSKDGIGSSGHDAGDWNVFYLFLHNIDFEANRKLCPCTSAIIESISGNYDHAFFSALSPRTHVAKHHGPTNKKLRCHLPLIVPPASAKGGDQACRLRVGDEVIHVKEGKCFVFDDSFEHEAWNDDPERSRVVLIVDVWHPDLTMSERKFLSFLRNAQLRSDKQRCEAADADDDFYHIITEINERSNQEESEGMDAKWSQQLATWG